MANIVIGGGYRWWRAGAKAGGQLRGGMDKVLGWGGALAICIGFWAGVIRYFFG